MTPKRKWLHLFLFLAAALLVLSFAISRALRTSAARRYLIAHLEASFGRPVEVGRFDFSLLDGARLEANSITISEDPRFGYEYFLRADALKAGLRWSALLSGRFEFGTLSLSRPSLNLVRDAQGHWNVEQWLPPAPSNATRPGFVGPPAAARDISTARLYRIDVDGGRINFKQGDDKSPLALIAVSGHVDHDSAGRWQLDLEGQPMRAGVALQQIGTLRLRGTIAGTSARLQPADLSLTWRDVSLADVLRLARESDFGVRGKLALDLTAKVAPPDPTSNGAAGRHGGAQWSISGAARLTGFHGWKMSERESDPGANLSFDAAWRLGEAHMQVRRIQMELPNSHLQGDGEVDWAHGIRPELHIDASNIGLSDVLAWYRALRPDVPENLSLDGMLGVDVTLSGWPPRIEKGALAGVGGKLTLPALPSPMLIGAINASASRGGLDFAPTEVSFSAANPGDALATPSPDKPPQDSFTMRGGIFPNESGVFRRPPNWSFSIEGATPRVESWLNLSQALAQPINNGWSATGGLAVKMRATQLSELPSTVWLGTMDFHDLHLNPVFMNQPVLLSKAHVEFAPSQKTAKIFGAQAFGAMWQGSLSRKKSDSRWTFDVSADLLDAAELDRWLGPRARPSLLTFLSGFGKSQVEAPDREDFISRISARGRIRIASLALAPLRFEKFDGDAELAGRTVTIRKAQADFFGGKAAGTFNAALTADPSYQFQGRFDRVDLARLGHATASLNNRISGIASATLTISSHGVGRESLVRSIQGDGKLDAREAELRGLNFANIISTSTPDRAMETFASAQGTFHVANGAITTSDLLLENSQGRFQAEGRIDFSRLLDMQIHPSIARTATKPDSARPQIFLLRGTIEAPIASATGLPPQAPVRAATHGR
jgi:AsmA-like protein